MPRLWHKLAPASGTTLIAALALIACGGNSSRDGSGVAGQGSSAGNAGSGGQAGYTALAGGGGSASACLYEGTVHASGSSFPAGDGCNTCSCGPGGSVSCTEIGCTSCQMLEGAFAAALDDAKRCDPTLSIEQCSETAPSPLVCSCDTFVNPAHADAITQLDDARTEYTELACFGEVFCEQCDPPTSAYCSAQGRCEDLWGSGSGAACKVGDTVYPSGSRGITAPAATCNTCTCNDGALICTLFYCPTPCPEFSDHGSQCAQCGPVDNCEVMEYGCFPICVDSCSDPGAVCIDGLCRSVCG
ncbi:MAG TPA: hypothetical protein VGP93_12355 [Polyangiaceae bacterium]|nr:hypothetical protein [Polyangiaceae bacterium]